MKKQVLITAMIAVGVFLMIQPRLMAQPTTTPEQKEADREAREAERAVREAAREARAISVVVPDMELPNIPGNDYGFAFSTGSSSERNSKLTISKDYDGETTQKSGTFDVGEGVNRIRISVKGFVKSGKINLEVYLPGKKELKKLSMDSSANIEWTESINVKEGETKYYGEWTYVISAENAKGFYSLSLNTY